MLHQPLTYYYSTYCYSLLLLKSVEEAEKFHPHTGLLLVCEKECKQIRFPVDLLECFMSYSVLEKALHR